LKNKIINVSLHPKKIDSLAQLVEQYTFNVWALGSNPRGITKETHFQQEMGFFFLITFKIYFDKLEKIKNHELRCSLGFMLGMSPHPQNNIFKLCAYVVL
jgi:hypothetical protein